MSNKQHMEITVSKAENVRETEGKIPAVRMEEGPFRNMARMFSQHHVIGSRLVANKGGLRL